jgi:hypothetical protein
MSNLHINHSGTGKVTLLLLGIALSALLYSCRKDKEEIASEAPIISILSISADTVVQFKDSLIIELRYEDRNGDLGNIDPDINDLEVKDSRLNTADYYHVKPLSPDGTSLFIKGTLRIKLNQLFLLGTGNSESAQFTFKLTDRAGNSSKEIKSDPIVIVRQ